MNVVRRRGFQQLLLMLSLVVGVVTMHSTVACHDDTGHAQHAAPSVGDSMATERPLAPSLTARAAVASGDGRTAGTAAAAAITPAGDELAGSSSDLGMVRELVIALAAPVMHAAGVGPFGQHSALHDLLHLCLAVLTGLLVLAAAALFAVLVGSATKRGTPLSGARPTAGPRAPPSTSVRLAQLCVLRN
ncbi:hypothetical protein [Pseudonocardia sp. WMMC193]|uniref:hypothetical protein n=1 Tax=Pseudonocardia sp. WMMC193 TaxID=2911965 RepID=UPI001F39EDF6|nr:hypothetical protein [Pseudonocardia sp. WMMC193]MCF7547443.1 hypothetical protein [Pseudonocardia sp. WMMC193]